MAESTYSFWPSRDVSFPFLGAVQAKHHRSPNRTTGAESVRAFRGALRLPVNIGIMITNTNFTPDAKWFAEQYPVGLRLRDTRDLQRWIKGNFTDDCDWREFPDRIELCPGMWVDIPWRNVRG